MPVWSTLRMVHRAVLSTSVRPSIRAGQLDLLPDLVGPHGRIAGMRVDGRELARDVGITRPVEYPPGRAGAAGERPVSP